MKVIVTGAAGFLGSHLVDRLLDDGDRVIGVDNFMTSSRANLEHIPTSRPFTFVEADIARPWTWAGALETPDLILHFASPASPVDYGRQPLATMGANALGVMYGVDLAHATGARFVFASTSEVYGDPLEHPQSETYWGNVNPVGARACYDESKRYGEAYLTSAIRTLGIDGRIVRIFNTYGPRMQPGDGRVVPNFCLAALRGEPLVVYGSGRQTRSFCYVSDLIDGIVRLAKQEGHRGRVVNIGNPNELAVADLARIISEIAGVPCNVVAGELPPDDPTRRRPVITVARTVLGWEPKVPLRDGLTATLQYFSETMARSELSALN
ncbi:MAG: NAD-dependent epimerase/dehydratase family protein [Candidatus Eremiobacteraeota bacterium]|nr:NAD-dependent epimerase/dehydratase family protein [Candidatus Eremiobacteraeota bacterium]MBV8373671.1 NAD-dependent epimerase/dehydratase family protein [Candidatus Eremiobacteraeota bacterium]